ncbi:MAG TPA: SapC family protein [Burkholderiales bacterium]|nr:SapC family protein [Burkholderiales bacterium]
MQISAPFGYKKIAPLRRDHKVRLPAIGEIPQFVRSLNAIPISFTEFGPVARDFLIAFTSGDGGKTYAAVAVLGLSPGENLFYDANAWAPGTYLPAYARRYPFCMARVTLDNVQQPNRLICVETDHVDDTAGESMFDAEGQATEKWKAIERLLTEYETDLERCRELCAILADYALLEPFTMQANLKQGGALQLAGMHRASEKKLEALNAAQLKNLLKKGILGRIYAHLLSLDNFARLLDRRAGRSQPS